MQNGEYHRLINPDLGRASIVQTLRAAVTYWALISRWQVVGAHSPANAQLPTKLRRGDGSDGGDGEDPSPYDATFTKLTPIRSTAYITVTPTCV